MEVIKMNILKIIIGILSYLPEIITLANKIIKLIKEDPELESPSRTELLKKVKDAKSFEELKKKLIRTS